MVRKYSLNVVAFVKRGEDRSGHDEELFRTGMLKPRNFHKNNLTLR